MLSLTLFVLFFWLINSLAVIPIQTDSFSQDQTSPGSMVYGLTCQNRRPLSSNERLVISTVVRKLELKSVQKAIASLASYSLVMPNRQSLKRWKRDQKVKAALQTHIKQAAGVQKTVNPLNLRPALI